MDSRWYKIKRNIHKKRYSLYSICVGFIFFIFLWILTLIFKKSLCPLKNILGVRCFGCGLTRGFIAILKHDFSSAMDYNILSIPLFLGIVLYICFIVIDILFSKNFTEKLELFMSKKFMFPIYIIVLLFSAIFNYR